MSGSNLALHKRSKNSLKVDLANDEDRISNLPDNLICHILSCLSVKDAVRTSILSKDWEYNWTSMYNFDILHDSSEEQLASFVNFMERLLLHAQDIRCFKLCFIGESDTSRFASWISDALRHKIETLELNFLMEGTGEKKERDDDAVCFLNSSFLRKLSVYSPQFQFPVMIFLPNLTSLYFNNVRILNESSNTNHVKYTFPVLKKLHLFRCKWLKVKLVEIHAPELTSFISVDNTEIPAEVDDGYSIKLIADKLETFVSDCNLPNEAIVTGPRVVGADFRFRYYGLIDGDDEFSREKGLQVLRLLKGFSSLMKLELTISMVEAMRKWRQQFPLPKFVKLAQLHLQGPVYSEGLLELLHAAPYLKFLSIFMNQKESWNHDDYGEVECIPLCVVSHLEEVLFTYCGVEDPQYYLEKFMLRNGKELKKFYAFISGELVRDEVLDKLSAFPKVSTYLTISTPSVREYSKINEKWHIW